MTVNRTHLLAASAALALISTGAQAQSAAAGNPVQPAPAAARDASAQDQAAAPGPEIIVTGSRVAVSGFTAPTPTKVLSAELLNQRGLSNIGDFLNEVPSFRATQTPQTNPQNALGAGQNFADLRALGSTRTLTLVDGRRFVPSSATGQVDLNLIPTLMIDRVDVVTGGASAAYGSDAVSGVVNIVTDRRLKGFKSDISYGISKEGDAAERRLSLAFGTPFAGDRGHVVIGGEYVKSDGVDSYFDRDWGRLQGDLVSYIGARPAGTPSRFYATGVQSIAYAYGGTILGVNADTNPANGADVLRGIQFGPGGAVQPFPYGTVVGTSSINFTGGDPGLYARNSLQLVLPVDRRVAMAHVDYDLTDSLSVFVDANYGRSGASFHTPSTRDTTAGAVVIQRSNAFLPAQIAAIMDANGISSFSLGRQNNDFGPVLARNQNTTERVVGGVEGKLGGGWSFDAYYEYGRNTFDSTIRNLRIEQNYRYAVDSILVGGQAVCRDTTARALGCQPINLFGVGSPSQAAINYVDGTAIYKVATTQQVGSANLRGEPFSTWAGPIAIAVGGEYRQEKAHADADAISQASGFNYNNPKAFDGSITVKEGYGEVVVPLARDVTLLHKLDVNGAVRYTNYSTTGGVTTWKVGATWEPIEGVLIRGTRSRDIRAPNNSELFAVNSVRASLVNSFSGVTDQFTVISQSSPTLRPEIADTKTIGISLAPKFLPGLNLSVDYYDISIDGAIGTFPAQTIIDGCVAEVGRNAPGFYCSFVNRTGTGTATVINSISTQLLNVAKLKTSGIDFDLSYRFPLGRGRLTTRLSGNYTAHLITDDGTGVARTYNAAGVITNVGSVVDRAGQSGGFTSGVITNGATAVPHWILNGSLTYAIGRVTATAQGRYIEGGVLDKTLVGPGDRDYDPASPISIANNRVSGAFYLNLSASVDVLKQGNRKVQFYGIVNNVTDKDPPFPAVGVTGLFDRIGRSYKLGLRVSY
ncbi:outer membrane receptor protein involved in Fe transport [Sphingomonas vulcanisoli]|uniref:Outer membrane receptor protein involved in Fe transport n=1 Tax=Sphingomonas vulcanisoli TaxID=1658060 RepID=A0ABX0TUT9_9SPHN|nr:TonB-dependent receptor [Sphingomonas vulcanisoli]NIJ09216.1 outer membrane receptor protein involved in Fe transport [Sphingomonas vulcanisoli]